MIPLTSEEYFDNEVCMNCHNVMDIPIRFYTSVQVVELCESCSFGLYQCARCGMMVSHLADTMYEDMVYTGPENTFDDFYIRCRGCSQAATPEKQEEEDNYDTETELEFEDLCDTEISTQVIC